MAALEFFLTLDGITSTSPKSDGIAIAGFNWGLSRDVSSPPESDGGATDRADADTWTFTKLVDGDSPQILLAVLDGHTIKTAELTAVKGGGKGHPVKYLDVTLTACVASNYQVVENGGGAPVEVFDLAFTKISYIVYTQNEKGVPVKHAASWDLATNKKA